MIVNICPSAENLSETISCLNYAARARNTVPSLGNRDTIKKWRDVVSECGTEREKIQIHALVQDLTRLMVMQASDARKELLDKERENQNLKQEVLGLKQSLKDANDQCVLLYSEVQRAWKVSFTLQSDLKVYTAFT